MEAGIQSFGSDEQSGSEGIVATLQGTGEGKDSLPQPTVGQHRNGSALLTKDGGQDSGK